jgi:hypothetical protein
MSDYLFQDDSYICPLRIAAGFATNFSKPFGWHADVTTLLDAKD